MSSFLGASATLTDKYLSVNIEFGDEENLTPQFLKSAKITLKAKDGTTLRTLETQTSYANADGCFKVGIVLFEEENPFTIFVSADTTRGFFTCSCDVKDNSNTITQSSGFDFTADKVELEEILPTNLHEIGPGNPLPLGTRGYYLGASATLTDRYLSVNIEFGDEFTLTPQFLKSANITLKSKDGTTLRTLETQTSYANADGCFKVGIVLFEEESPSHIYVVADTSQGLYTANCDIKTNPNTITQSSGFDRIYSAPTPPEPSPEIGPTGPTGPSGPTGPTGPGLLNIHQNTIIGRISPGLGNVEELNSTQATSILNVFNTLKGLVPGVTPSNLDFLRADGIFAKIRTSTIQPDFAFTFAILDNLMELGQTSSYPSFVAAYNEVITLARLRDSDNGIWDEVVLPATSFDSPYIFTHDSITNVTFTLEATSIEGDVVEMETDLTWNPKRYWGVGLYTGQGQSFIINLEFFDLAQQRNKNFTVTAGHNQKIYYAIPTTFGTPIFSVNGFIGGFKQVEDSLIVTNAYGVMTPYQLWESDHANLGLINVVVT
jgi:hypothetical protein